MIPQSAGASLTLLAVTNPPINAEGKSAISDSDEIKLSGSGLASAAADSTLIRIIPEINVTKSPQREHFSTDVKSGDSSPERDRAATGVVRERTSAEDL